MNEQIMSQLIKMEKEYALWISELSNRFKSMQIKAATKVNHEMLAFYWTLGKDIEKMQAEQKWGSSFFTTLSMDLRTELPGQEGFSETNIRYMKRFYVLYSQNLPQLVEDFEDDEINPQIVDIICAVPWGHHRYIIDKCKGNNHMKIVCISASNIVGQASENSTSFKICQIIINEIKREVKEFQSKIIELRKQQIQPCVGCGKCFHNHRCFADDNFNDIYMQIIDADIVFIVSPHYAPIPAKLSALLEKMEQITFLHWGKDNSYKSEVYETTTGVISHGGGGAWALNSYKNMVNDTIANALDTIQMELIPFNNEWNTGIALPVDKVHFQENNIFPCQEYDWNFITDKISEYVEKIIGHHLRKVKNT